MSPEILLAQNNNDESIQTQPHNVEIDNIALESIFNEAKREKTVANFHLQTYIALLDETKAVENEYMASYNKKW